jgi:tetratricopeptide (TPR) repeat protein
MLNKALTHFKNGEYSSSKIILEKILQIKHRNVEALHLLGIIFAIEKNFTVAIDYFSKALKLNPLDQKVLFNRANAYYEFGKPELSISDTEKLILLNNKNVDALLINSNAKMAYGDIDGAIVSLDRVLNINPNNYKALVNKGSLLIEQGKFNAAIETLNNSIRIKNNDKKLIVNKIITNTIVP